MASSGTLGLEFAGIDKVPIINKSQFTIPPEGTVKNLEQEVELNLDELHQLLYTDPTGIKEVRIDQTVDLTDLGAAFVAIATIPAGSKVKLAKIQILSAVTDDGDGDSLGLGTNGTTPALLLQGAANLTKNYQIGKVPADSVAIIASQTTIDLCATVNADGSLSDGDLTAGSVRVLIVYDTPAILPNV